jgi:hypothetical protein
MSRLGLVLHDAAYGAGLILWVLFLPWIIVIDILDEVRHRA